MKSFTRFAGAVLVALALAACHAPASESDSASTMQLKLYPVPVEQSSAIEQSLWNALAGSTAGTDNGGANSGMRVTQPFPGTLMVLAPPNVQTGVANVLATLGKPGAIPDASKSLQVHFWLVSAVPGQGEDSPALKPLGDTLDRLRGSLGPSHFRLDAAVAAAGTMGEDGQMTASGQGHFNFKATPGRGGAINLLVAYRDPDHASGIDDLVTTVAMDPGQYVVLAQAPTPPTAVAGSKSTINGKGERKMTLFDSQGKPLDSQRTPSMRLLVVRVDRPSSASH